MSVSYFIGPFDPALWKYGDPSPEPKSSLRIDPADYWDKLLERWPSAREWQSEEFATGVYWTLDEYNLYGVEVQLHKDLQYVSFSSGGVNFADFILWHRDYVTHEHILYLFNSSSWESLILDADTDRKEVIEFCGLMGEELVKESPLNGTWDGSVTPMGENLEVLYRCTLHVFEHSDGLRVECLIRKQGLGSGSIYVELRGSLSGYDDQFDLLRERTINTVGSGLESEIESYDVLRLLYHNGDPPILSGSCLEKRQGVEWILGEVRLSLRPLYDPPPA